MKKATCVLLLLAITFSGLTQSTLSKEEYLKKSKKQKIRRNMECRRKLEEKWEERKLRRETSEYEFEFMH